MLFRVAFWTACALAFAMSVVPNPPDVHVWDKLQHAFAFLVLAALGHLAYPRTRKRWLLVGLMLFGAAIEIAQSLPFVQRDSDPLDWVADTLAALSVLVVVALWTFVQDRRKS